MGAVKPFPNYLIIVGLLWNPTQIDNQDIVYSIDTAFGPITDRSASIHYTHSKYYMPEMGDPLLRQWVVIKPTSHTEFYRLKQASQWLENQFSVAARRVVNIDPGVLFSHNLMLLSTKNYAHRLPLSEGIYGELELIYQNKMWVPLPWTYPDYQTEPFLTWLNHLRHKI